VTLCPPDSNIVCFAFRDVGRKLSLAQLNELNGRLYRGFTISANAQERVYGQTYFVGHTTLSPESYSANTIQDFLERLRVRPEEYASNGVFLLRTVLMNPWYSQAKKRGRFFISELVEELYAKASLLSERIAGEHRSETRQMA
jgi:hypothetical protein